MKKVFLVILTSLISTGTCFANFLDNNSIRYQKMPDMKFYTSPMIMKNTTRYFYNYNKQQIDSQLINSLLFYHEDGTPILTKRNSSFKSGEIIHLTEKSNGYIEANAAFYHRWFSKDFEKKIEKHNKEILNEFKTTKN